MIDTPEYLKLACDDTQATKDKATALGTAAAATTGGKWLKSYLAHVQRRQEMRQNHVHLWNEKKKCKMPLAHCQSADNPAKCKPFFPRTKWLVDKTLVLCKAFLKQRDNAVYG